MVFNEFIEGRAYILGGVDEINFTFETKISHSLASRGNNKRSVFLSEAMQFANEGTQIIIEIVYEAWHCLFINCFKIASVTKGCYVVTSGMIMMVYLGDAIVKGD